MKRINIFILALSLLFFLSCSKKTTVKWPDETGYIKKPSKRPFFPHNVKETTTRLKIIDSYMGKLRMQGKGEIKNGEMIIIFPGAEIKNDSGSKVKLTDYNGDTCKIPYGMTVKIDKYGQFVPIKFEPN